MATAGEEFVPRRRSLGDGFRVQLRVIGGLMMRELHTRYGRANIGYLWLILEPMLLAAMVSLLKARAVRRFGGGDMDPVTASIVAYCNFQVFRAIFVRAEGAIEHNLPLMYHRTVSVLDILVSRALLEAAGCWVAFAILGFFAVAAGFSELPARPLYLLTGMFALLWLSFAGSMVIAAITYGRSSIGRLVHPFTYIMLPLSGAFFTMQMLPSEYREIFLWNPMAHCFEILRYGWFKSATIIYVDWMYLGEWLLISTLFGLLLLSTVRKRIHTH